ncbi:CAP domain-containing protein [Cellulomonas sp. HD19AZ1]|uniref:CAP domain-containing protein n=1 Tax=Cellulomonas TaxID=1707 RepID=UPI00107111D9|nr:CAP domain-containing protein [Cellulomonas sp. HD19AZ1]TFH70653.1 CAP domain-containing protein [Cellulomonas sp. HD19AZ1]
MPRPDAARAPRRSRPGLVATGLLVGAALLGGGAVAAAAFRDAAPRPSSSPRTASSPWPSTDLDAYAAQLLAAADAARTAAGLPAWQAAPCAQGPAGERAAALVGADLEHAPLGPVLTACAPLGTAAENLSRAAAPPADVVDAWLGSAGHRANVEDPALTQAAAACVPDADQVLCSLVLVGP